MNINRKQVTRFLEGIIKFLIFNIIFYHLILFLYLLDKVFRKILSITFPVMIGAYEKFLDVLYQGFFAIHEQLLGYGLLEILSYGYYHLNIFVSYIVFIAIQAIILTLIISPKSILKNKSIIISFIILVIMIGNLL